MSEVYLPWFSLEGVPDAPIVVLASSLGTTNQLWDPQVEQWSSQLQLIRYDHPGHGGSPVPEQQFTVDDLATIVLQMLDAVGVERVSFCGISLGGCVGMSLAAHAPERVDRLVLACTSPRFGSRETWLERAETVRARGLEAIADSVLDRWVAPDYPAREEVRKMLLATPAEGYARCCEALADFDARPYLDRIEAPTLVVHGADDPAVSRDDLAILTELIPDSRLVELPDARHLANLEQPEAFARAVREFVS